MQGDYSVVFFIEELRASGADARGDAASLERAMPLLLRLARASSSWTRPSVRGAPPHNHGTWAVVAGVDGEEENTLWRRRGGRLQAQGTHTIGPGQAAGFLPTAIHSVANRGQRTTLSLQSTGETCASWSGASSTHEPAPRIRSS
jgi:hypothetical protein